MLMEHLNTIFLSIMMVLSVPLIFLNWVSGITSVIWLGVLGDWKSAIGGVVISFAGPFIISIPMMLSAIPGFFAIKISNSGDLNQFLLGLLLVITAFIRWFIMALWGIIIFFISMYQGFLPNQENIDILPYLILAYSVTVAPLNYMASKEQKLGDTDKASSLPCFFAQLASLWAALAIYFDAPAAFGPVTGFLGIMAFGFLMTAFTQGFKISGD